MAASKFRVPVLNPCDPRALLREHGIHPSRALGQNFLADPNTARRIVRLADVGPGTRVLEIGPGLGALTVALAEAGATVHALELDRHLIPILKAVVSGIPNVTVEQGDALTWDFAALRDEPLRDKSLRDKSWVCVSNLPYNVATPVVARLLEEAPQMTRMLLMVQREVGERLVAPPGSRIYGAVSVKVAYHATSRIVGAVPPTVFVPRPKVDSALVLLERRPAPSVDVPSYDALFRLVGAGFAQRRKMLRRALVPVLADRTEAVLIAAGVAPTERAEALDLESWASLARAAS